jgi:cytochrome c-type biogenesis protein CcmH
MNQLTRSLLMLSLCSVFVLTGLLLSDTAQATQENYQFATEQQRQDFKRLTKELRCPMCQNQNIADSDAMIAHDMRRKVYQLLSQGNDHDQVIDFMKQRYGDFVYYQPPVNNSTIWLWILPFSVLLVGGWILFKRRPEMSSSDDKVEADLLAKADEMLEKDK